MNILEGNTREEIVTVGIEIRFSGTRENVDAAIENLAQDADIQSEISKVEVDIEEPVEIECK